MTQQRLREFKQKYTECPDCGSKKGCLFSLQLMFTNDPAYNCRFCGFSETLSETC